MKRNSDLLRRPYLIALLALPLIAFLIRHGSLTAAGQQTPVKFTEEVVYAQSDDSVPNAGVLYRCEWFR